MRNTVLNNCEQLLVDILNQKLPLDKERLQQLTPEQVQELLWLAAAQQVSSLVWHRLKQKGLAGEIPPNLAESLRDSFRSNTMINLRNYGELKALLTVLNTERIPMILLKGIYLADAVYENRALREMVDIDLLGRIDNMERIVAILKGKGYAARKQFSTELTLKIDQHLPRFLKKGGAAVEVHGNLMNRYDPGYIEPDVFWENAVAVRIAGCDALVLPPSLLLLHLCYHTSYNHQFAFGLRPSCDIATVIKHFGTALDWPDLIAKARGWGWQRGVYLALRLARELTGAAVPDDVLAELRPQSMKDEIVATARSQIFSDKAIANSIPDSLARLLASPSLLVKCRIFLQRIFASKEYLASQYAVKPDSIGIYACYLYRIFDLFRHHGGSMKLHSEDNPEIHGIVVRKNILVDWLSKEI